ncbi:hypothetical protein H9C73_14020 [Marinobacterium sp. AK62]|uniref:Uncharacterized protein n=1 Tax=Marinobacterium alkalitolerans TaxID=1542925 RepID=A0ABS3ZEV3_9GAMM|nr:hypothetical protein [Marinobacterium alkalitolerans]MBP0049845.1 hypothetical protein [Marinobacterium alkalitolerans]
MDVFRAWLRLCVWGVLSALVQTASAAEISSSSKIYYAEGGFPYSTWGTGVCRQLGYAAAYSSGAYIYCSDTGRNDDLHDRVYESLCRYAMWHPACNDEVPFPDEKCQEWEGGEVVLEMDAFTGGYPSQYYSVEGCRAVTTTAGCADDLETGNRVCTAIVEFTGEEATGTAEEGQCDVESGCETAGEEPKKCFDSNGVYLGTVSANSSCPAGYTDDPQGEKNCLNPDGTVGYIVGGSAECPEGTTAEDDNSSPTDPTDYTNSDGSLDTGDGTGDSDASTGDGSTGDGSTGDGSSGDGSGSGDPDVQPDDQNQPDCDPTKFGKDGCLKPTDEQQERGKDAGLGSFMERLDAVPIIAAVKDISGSVPSGSCSPLSIDTAFFSSSTNIHCTVIAENSGILEAVFTAIWALFGIRIVMSA